MEEDCREREREGKEKREGEEKEIRVDGSEEELGGGGGRGKRGEEGRDGQRSTWYIVSICMCTI